MSINKQKRMLHKSISIVLRTVWGSFSYSNSDKISIIFQTQVNVRGLSHFSLTVVQEACLVPEKRVQLRKHREMRAILTAEQIKR